MGTKGNKCGYRGLALRVLVSGAALNLGLVGCSADEPSASGEGRLAIEANYGAAEDGYFIQPTDVQPADGAPEWCKSILDPNVAAIPSALVLLGDRVRAEGVSAVFGEAATVLENNVDAAPAQVKEAAKMLAADLRMIDPADPASEDVTALASSLGSFGTEVESCQFS